MTKDKKAKPVAWVFELANRWQGGVYSEWSQPQLSFNKPNVPEGSIRNLKALVPRDE